ncbi:MAG TPA: hypothetical protein DDW65_19545 [Firmicutes bacterium]|nr:hypothetical protein [Bacillota bacterium]
MLAKLYIDNFKVLNEFEICFTPLTVLIGENASGKSTVLQAIDILQALMVIDLDVYLKNRNWTVADIRSQFNKSRTIVFRATLKLTREYNWEIELALNISANSILVKQEKITDDTGKLLLNFDGSKISRLNEVTENKDIFPSSLNLSSSFLKTMSIEKDMADYPGLIEIKSFFAQVDSFELLSPEKMRMSNRGKTNSIGMSGEKLPAFIRGLKPERKKSFLKILKRFVNSIEDIDTFVKGRPGWIEMSVKEKFGENLTKIKSEYVSDGLLRLIALASLAEIDKTSGLMLLDEIEDGINPYLAGQVVEVLQKLTRDIGRQIVITTHSTIMLDYFNKESIVFLWRKQDGNVQATNLFVENDKIKEMLEYMYPGEAWLNLQGSELLAKVTGRYEDKKK